MTLNECSKKISELNADLSELLEEREQYLQKWNQIFCENHEDIRCEDDYNGHRHILFLVNGENRLKVCSFSDSDLNKDINAFYKIIHESVRFQNLINHRELHSPDWELNLILGKAIEIRDGLNKQ